MAQYDDEIGRQIPWASDQCPQRGTLLSHFLHGLVGPCVHCGAECIRPIDLERSYNKPVIMDEVLAQYQRDARHHGINQAAANASRRPIRALIHKHAVDRLDRVSMAEAFDPLPPTPDTV